MLWCPYDIPTVITKVICLGNNIQQVAKTPFIIKQTFNTALSGSSLAKIHDVLC